MQILSGKLVQLSANIQTYGRRIPIVSPNVIEISSKKTGEASIADSACVIPTIPYAVYCHLTRTTSFAENSISINATSVNS